MSENSIESDWMNIALDGYFFNFVTSGSFDIEMSITGEIRGFTCIYEQFGISSSGYAEYKMFQRERRVGSKFIDGLVWRQGTAS